METLQADTLTDARRERESLLVSLREGRLSAPDAVTFDALFAEYQLARNLQPQTRDHERTLVRLYLAPLKGRRAQDVAAADIAKLLRGLRARFSPWTQVAVQRILTGSFELGVRRSVLTRSPMDGLAKSERPSPRNKTRIVVLDAAAIEKLVAAGGSTRWRAALALAAYAGLRIGEVRALRWADIDLDAGVIHIRRSMLRDGTPKTPKTDAGARSIPLLPALRRRLVGWKIEAPHSGPADLVLGTADGKPIAERNANRALATAKTAAKLGEVDGRLSWHSLRHAFASLCATDLDLPATTLARLIGHTNAGYTLKVYARDGRSDATVAKDVHDRARSAGLGA